MTEQPNLAASEPFESLEGQVALVTGGSRGLGRAFAQALADAGARVAITARSADELQQAASEMNEGAGNVIALPADVTDPDAASRVAATVIEAFGSITLLVNNAGQFRAFGLLGHVDPAAWWRELEVNLRGPFLYAHAVLPHMRARGAGRIINVASGAGLSPIPNASAYGVSKTALIRLTETLAHETAATGIAVFALDPGTMRTPMNDYVHSAPEVAQAAPYIQEWFQKVYAEGLDRPISDAANLMLRLARGEADALSGSFVSVADDLDALVREQASDPHGDRHRLRLYRHA
jgi:NAD(P)-dependent dehydrogenase (short-subunit alcohol dehydrogenase family)